MTTLANTTSRQERVVIGSRVDAQLAKEVREAAQAEDRSVGYLIRRALRNELERIRRPHTIS